MKIATIWKLTQNENYHNMKIDTIWNLFWLIFLAVPTQLYWLHCLSRSNSLSLIHIIEKTWRKNFILLPDHVADLVLHLMHLPSHHLGTLLSNLAPIGHLATPVIQQTSIERESESVTDLLTYLLTVIGARDTCASKKSRMWQYFYCHYYEIQTWNENLWLTLFYHQAFIWYFCVCIVMPFFHYCDDAGQV